MPACMGESERSSSQICSDVPNELYCTMYENGFCMSVTWKYFPSGDASTAEIMPGAPIFFTAPLLVLIVASWPVT